MAQGLSQSVTVQALVTATLTTTHSLRTRGVRRTLLFVVLGIGIPAAGEYAAVHLLRLLRHHGRPQIKGVPLNALLGWYNIGYASFALNESLLPTLRWTRRVRRWVLPSATAVLATSLDLLMDCWCLDAGLWHWNTNGRYAADIKGVNGRYGIPLLNFAGWLAATGGITLLYLIASDSDVKNQFRSSAVDSVRAGQAAALLMLPYYLASLAWAIRRRKFRYVLYSALVPLALTAALLRRLPS